MITRFRDWLSGLLIRLAWVLGATHIVYQVPMDDLWRSAVDLTWKAENEYPNGQARWHYVFGMLLKKFPNRKKDIAKAIEAAR